MNGFTWIPELYGLWMQLNWMTYELNNVYESEIANIVTIRNIEVTSDKLNIDIICKWCVIFYNIVILNKLRVIVTKQSQERICSVINLRKQKVDCLTSARKYWFRFICFQAKVCKLTGYVVYQHFFASWTSELIQWAIRGFTLMWPALRHALLHLWDKHIYLYLESPRQTVTWATDWFWSNKNVPSVSGRDSVAVTGRNSAERVLLQGVATLPKWAPGPSSPGGSTW
jgi:hypothetical protein